MIATFFCLLLSLTKAFLQHFFNSHEDYIFEVFCLQSFPHAFDVCGSRGNYDTVDTDEACGDVSRPKKT